MGSGTPPLAPRNPPLLFLTVILFQQECNGLSIPEIQDHLQSEMKRRYRFRWNQFGTPHPRNPGYAPGLLQAT